MPLRIGFDMDGVLADFSAAFHEIESQLFGPGVCLSEGQPEQEEQAQETGGQTEARSALDGATPPNHYAHEARRRRDLIWRKIQATPNFWQSLKPMDPAAVPRIHA